MAPIFSPTLLFIIQLMIVTTQSILFNIASAISFTLPLIPPFSPESPFYQENLTQHQQLNHILSQTDYNLNSQSFKTSAKKFHLPVTKIPPALFVTKLVLGTPAKTQVLLIDTGSDFTWIQCKQCFDQTPIPIFDPSHSSSYQKVPCGPNCKLPYLCIDGVCKYFSKYVGNVSSNGPVSIENFIFGDHHVKMVFGCSENIRGNVSFQGKGISGILGLDTFRHSLVKQLLSPRHRRFSYCLVRGLNRSGLLKIGEDATIRGSSDTIDFVRQEISTHYFLNLIDISVGSKRMHFPRGMFELHSDGNGGCYIDSGAPSTFLDEVPYNRVMAEFDRHFKSHGLRRMDSSEFEYCYGYDHRHFKKFIKMTFHFDRSVDYVVDSPNMYVMAPAKGLFCVALMKAKGRNVLGAWQQMNKRIVYDITNKKLHFKDEDCARDAHYSRSLIL